MRRDPARELLGAPQPALPPGAERLAALLPAAESRNESIRAVTMDRLVAFADRYPEAVACLSRAAQRDPSVRVRMRAMSALNRLPELPPLAQSALVVAFQTDASPELRAQAVRVLDRHQLADALPIGPLLSALGEPDAALRAAVRPIVKHRAATDARLA
jgi:hypothetical protein